MLWLALASLFRCYRHLQYCSPWCCHRYHLRPVGVTCMLVLSHLYYNIMNFFCFTFPSFLLSSMQKWYYSRIKYWWRMFRHVWPSRIHNWRLITCIANVMNAIIRVTSPGIVQFASSANKSLLLNVNSRMKNVNWTNFRDCLVNYVIDFVQFAAGTLPLLKRGAV